MEIAELVTDFLGTKQPCEADESCGIFSAMEIKMHIEHSYDNFINSTEIAEINKTLKAKGFVFDNGFWFFK